MSALERRSRSSAAKASSSAAKHLLEARQIGLGGAFGGPLGGLAFEHAAEFEHVFAQIGVGAHHVLPGIEES